MIHTQQKKHYVTGKENPVCQWQEEQQKDKKNRGTEEKTNLQKKNYRSLPTRRKDVPMKRQNRENEKKSYTYRRETEEAPGREKIGEGAIRKRRTQKGDCYQTKNSRGQRHKRKSRTKKYDRGKKYKNGKYLHWKNFPQLPK